MEKNLAEKRIQNWLTGPYDKETKDQIIKMQKENPDELLENFSKNLSFGTGGIREKMGIGTNRLNKYTICTATQALCNYINGKQEKKPSIIIGYDNRKNSSFFAKEAAKVIAANNIKVFIFDEIRPTPLISFGCRYKNCTAAIMITASHNPKEYNGFKVYWKDGGQVLPPHDQKIIEEYNKISSFEDVKIISSFSHPLINIIKDEIDKAYFEKLFSLEIFSSKVENPEIKIVYSNLHGAGITILPKCFERYGFNHLYIVEEQKELDPNFTNAAKPNPEEKIALELGIKYLKEKKADIFLSNDPDADRMGVVVNHKNQIHILSGNQIACIILDYLCSLIKTDKKSYAVKTIVTTEMFKKICDYHHISCFDVLTGFKYIAQKIGELEKEKYKFLFGAEESLGYLIEDFVRDKDGISAPLLIAKIANAAKKENKTLVDLLNNLYKKHGVYREKLSSFSFEKLPDSMGKMKTVMKNLRLNPLKMIGNLKVDRIDDYLSQESLELLINSRTNLTLPKSDVLRFWLSDNSNIVIRPSGTEPKMKVYVGNHLLNIKDLEEDIKRCDASLDAIIDAVRLQINI
ncbi:MAG: phospho-sugar mutase [Parachlamydiales bacterium]|jgi:phosphoglucomutase/phosphomannomutase